MNNEETNSADNQPSAFGKVFHGLKRGASRAGQTAISTTKKGAQQGGQLAQTTGQDCATTASFTPPTPGVFAVEVSQYGGTPPWVLAGFYTASGGAPQLPTIEPGYPCPVTPAPGDPGCASATPYACTCVAGRCQCQCCPAEPGPEARPGVLEEKSSRSSLGRFKLSNRMT